MNPELAAELRRSVEVHKQGKAATEEALRTNNPFAGQPQEGRKEALAALQKLDQKNLENLRKKLAGVKAPDEFPEGTKEIPLSDEDIEIVN